MKERPILFSAPMVRAILSGAKTQTRRVVKPQPIEDRLHDHVERKYGLFTWWAGNRTFGIQHQARCPYGQPGERLWVRETWNVTHHSQLAPGENIAKSAEDCVRDNNGFMPSCAEGVVYAADGVTSHPVHGKARWRPSIHMPRWASRITLEIVAVRVERLWDISEADCAKEGAPFSYSGFDPDEAPDWRGWYRSIWEAVYGPDSWVANPWVWVLTFRRVEP